MENIIIESGPCGRFQILHIVLTQALRFFLIWSIYFMTFGAFDPGWTCVTSDATRVMNGTDSIVNIPSTLAKRVIDNRSGVIENIDINFNKSPVMISSTIGDVSELASNPYNGTCDIIDTCDEIRFNPVSSTIVSEFGLVCDRTWVLSLIIFMQGAGFMVGSLFWGQIGELYGRKTSLYTSAVLMALCNGLAVFSKTWEVYAFFSVLIGVGGVGILSSVSVFGLEFLSPKWRGIFASLPVWNVSTVAFAGVVIFLKNWKYLHIANAVLTGIWCLGYFWVSESPRWLAAHGQLDKATRVITKIARHNKKPIPNLRAIEMLSNTDKFKRYTYVDLFKTRKVSVNVAKLSICFMILSLSHSLIAWSVYALPGNFYINLMLVSCADFPGVLVVGFLANKIGRRFTISGFSALATLCFCTTVVARLCIDDAHVADKVVISFVLIGRGSITTVLTMITPFSVELLPTVVRSVGIGFLITVSRVGGLVASFLLPHDNTSFILSYSVLTVCGVIACVTYLSLPETNNKPLTDTLDEARSENQETTTMQNAETNLNPTTTA